MTGAGIILKTNGPCLLPSPSFQRKLESSGLCNTFPLCGNDNKGGIAVGREKPQFVYHPGLAFLDSSFRWNDDGGGMKKKAEDQKERQWQKPE